MKKAAPKIKQPMSDELTESLLNLIQTKFYSGHPRRFAQDRKRLLVWVVFYPARWLNGKSLTLPPNRYREIMVDIIKEAALHGNLGEITYLPAWLAKTVQSHWRIHGGGLLRRGEVDAQFGGSSFGGDWRASAGRAGCRKGNGGGEPVVGGRQGQKDRSTPP